MDNPTQMNSVLDELRGMIADIIDIDKKLIEPDTHLINDLGVDSLLSLEVMAALERKYRTRLSEEDLKQMYSLRKIYELLKSRNSLGLDCAQDRE